MHGWRGFSAGLVLAGVLLIVGCGESSEPLYSAEGAAPCVGLHSGDVADRGDPGVQFAAPELDAAARAGFIAYGGLQADGGFEVYVFESEAAAKDAMAAHAKTHDDNDITVDRNAVVRVKGPTVDGDPAQQQQVIMDCLRRSAGEEVEARTAAVPAETTPAAPAEAPEEVAGALDCLAQVTIEEPEENLGTLAFFPDDEGARTWSWAGYLGGAGDDRYSLEMAAAPDESQTQALVDAVLQEYAGNVLAPLEILTVGPVVMAYGRGTVQDAKTRGPLAEALECLEQSAKTVHRNY